ncbi:hypothetical protein NQD34_013064 [Periophthalmus magnuspinnatus]|nr:hypothetical protein NQD34_013064 [Periophthalmus magnuspinnatus]
MKVRFCVLGPVLVVLCSIPQTGYGIQADSKPSGPISGSSADQRSQQMTSKSRRNPWSRTSTESRLESIEYRRPQNILQDPQSLNSRLKLQPIDKYVANLRQQRNNSTKKSLPSRSKSKIGSPIESRSKLSSKNGTTSLSSSSPTMIKNHSKLKSSSLAVPIVDDVKLSKAEDRSQTRADKNLTKTEDLDSKETHKPKRGWVWNQFYVLEEHMGPEPQYVGKLHSNSDKGDGSVRYILSGEGAGSLFTIDEDTGDIHAPISLDRETKAQYVLHARAVDRRTNRSIETQSEFIIKVQDVNDNPPTFPDGPFSATVPEMSDVGTSVFQVTASDADDPTYGNSAKIVYSLLEGQPHFSVDPKTGVIRTAVSTLDRETRAQYSVLVQAKDMAGSVGGLSGSTTINITLSDVNDNPPKFPQKSYQLYVTELTPVGKAVGRIQAFDEDEGPNAEMSYSITNSEAAAIFDISPDPTHREGIISLKQPLNHEKRKVHTLNIEVWNPQPESRYSHLGPFRDSTSLQVIVGDVDEPPLFSMDFYILDVYENSPAGTQVGTVSAWDPDTTNSAIRYFIEKEEGSPMFFTIGVNSGLIRTNQALDREEAAWHNLTVMAAEVDNPRMISYVQVTIQVLDVNDNIPSVAGGNSAIIACDNTKIGQVIQTIRAADRDNFANGKFSFRVPPEHQVNPNFTIRDNGGKT